MASRPPKNFTGITAPGGGLDLAAEDGFHALHAAAFGCRRKLDDQKTRQTSAASPSETGSSHPK